MIRGTAVDFSPRVCTERVIDETTPKPTLEPELDVTGKRDASHQGGVALADVSLMSPAVDEDENLDAQRAA